MFFRALVLVLVGVIAGCSSGGNSSPDPPPFGGPPPAATVPTISAQPASVSVAAGQSATFSVTATGTAPFTYQWKRDGVDIAGATSATYIAPAVTMGDTGVSYTVVVTNSAGSVTTTAATLTVTAAPGTTATVATKQTTALLSTIGQTILLEAGPVDGSGAPVAGAVTWESTDPSAVSVDSNGRITANKIGSSLLYATANGVKSQPVFILVAEPKPGSLVLTDSQVISVGAPLHLDPDAFPVIGTQYEVIVTGVTTAPAPGTVVIASGDALVAGKVVSTRNEAGNLVLLLETAAFPDLLARYQINWDIDLSTIPVEPIEINTGPAVVAKAGQAQQSVLAEAQAQLATNNSFTCDWTAGASLVSVEIKLTPQIASHLVVEADRRDPDLPPSSGKLALVGSQSLKGTVALTLNAALKLEGGCVAQTQIPVRVLGLASFFISPALRLGVGFELEGEMIAATGVLRAVGIIGAEETLGFQCRSTPAPGCEPIDDVKMIDDFKFTKELPTANDMRVDLSGQIYAVAGIDIVVLSGVAGAEILEARVGPKQKFEIASPDNQAKNRGSASQYYMDFDLLFQPGEDLADLIKKFVGSDVSLNLKAPYSTRLATSPKGTLTLTSGNVGIGTAVGFQVDLIEPLSYPLLLDGGGISYNVKEVELWRKKDTEPKFTLWKTLAASDGQTLFQHEWTPTDEDKGDYEFAAFVKTKMVVPSLEIAEDSVKPLHVRAPGWYGNITFTLEGSTTTSTTTPSVTGSSTTTKTVNEAASGTYFIESLPGAEGVPPMNVTAASGTGSRNEVETYDNNYDFSGCRISVAQTRERVESGPIASTIGTVALLLIEEDGSYQLQVPGMFGVTSITERTVATENQTGPAGCDDPTATDVTSYFEGYISTAQIMVSGLPGPNPKVLEGQATFTTPTLPVRTYHVSWNLQR